MNFEENYTTEKRKTDNPSKEKDKIVVSEEFFILAKILSEIRDELARGNR